MEWSCPACGVVPKKHNIPIIDIPMDTEVKSPLTNEMMQFNEAIYDYIRHYFPCLHETTYRVPAALFYESKGDLDLFTDEDITGDACTKKLKSTRKSASEVIVDRFQKDAVERVVSAFYAWGTARGEVMFLLSEYKLSSYCKLVTNNTTLKLPGEHDLLVFIPRLGVILVEVKSVPSERALKTKRKNVRGAWEQVLRNENSFRVMNAKLDFVSDIPVYHLIALPNLTEADLQVSNVCDLHRKHIMYKYTLESAENVDVFLSSLFNTARSIADSTVLTNEQYQELCARYAGFASVVHVRTVGDAVKKTAAKMARIFLTPQQLALLSPSIPTRLVLTGEYGTGKSLVLKTLAEQLANTDVPYVVFVVSCSNVSHTRTMGRLRKSNNHLVGHIQHLLVDRAEGVTVCSLTDLVRQCFPLEDPFSQRLSPRLIAEAVSSLSNLYPDKQLAVLLDEVPFVPSWDWGPVEEYCRTNHETLLWMSIATGTYAVRENADSPSSVISSHVPHGFPVTHLTRCMRMTRNGLRFYKGLQQLLGDKAHLFMEDGNAIDGPIPRWYELPHCSCGTADPFSCSCIAGRMEQTLQLVWKHLGRVDASQVSFVVRDSIQSTDKFLTALIMKACSQLNIPLKSYLPSASHGDETTPVSNELESSEKDTSCNLVDIFSFKGCECPIVVFVTPFCWPLVWEHRSGRHGWDDISPQISRALGQIILITWPPTEMDFFSLQAVQGTIDSYSDIPKTADESEKEFASVMTSKLEEVIETYQGRNETGTYFDVLVKQGVLVKIPVSV